MLSSGRQSLLVLYRWLIFRAQAARIHPFGTTGIHSDPLTMNGEGGYTLLSSRSCSTHKIWTSKCILSPLFARRCVGVARGTRAAPDLRAERLPRSHAVRVQEFGKILDPRKRGATPGENLSEFQSGHID